MDVRNQKSPAKDLAPVHFFSHGSTAMLGEESKSADYWKECGDAALANGIEHIIIMASLSVVAVVFQRANSLSQGSSLGRDRG